MKNTVLKFGGTSMGSAEAMGGVADIVAGGAGDVSAGQVVVVSATSGTTDALLELADLATSNGPWERALRELIERHDEIVGELGLNLDLSGFWLNTKNILQGVSLIMEISMSAKDRLLTVGERVSSTILAELLENRGVGAQAVDAFEFIFTDDNYGSANVDFEKTDSAVVAMLLPLLEDGIVPIVTGFNGQSPSGHHTTLGRGGSDYTGAILAAALDAEELQIWTDVDGIFSIDPRLIPGAEVIEQLSFNEAGELAYFGAKVLHPKTIKPAIEKNIPVRILNTFNPEAAGSLITNEESESIKSVTYKKGINIINICSVGMLNSHGFLAKIFDVFANHEVVVDVVSTSEVSVSVTVEGEIPAKLLEELGDFANVTVHENMAVVCLVGEGIKTNKNVLGRLFSSLGEHVISMVSQGASQRNITFLVNADEAQEVVGKIYNTFFNQ